MTAFTEHARRLATALGIAPTDVSGNARVSAGQSNPNDHSQRGLQLHKDMQTVKTLASMLEAEQNKWAFFQSGQGRGTAEWLRSDLRLTDGNFSYALQASIAP